MGVKKVVCLKEVACREVKRLLEEGYGKVIIYFRGSKEHKKWGLRDDVVLIHAIKYKGRKDGNEGSGKGD